MSEKEEKENPEEELLDEVKDSFKSARKHSSSWRSEAVTLYDFASGHQWEERDKARLEEEGRPVVTFDRTGPYYDAVCGSEVNNRQEIKYLPRTTGDSKQNEILTAAVKWVLDNTNAQDQESDSFRDMLICGMGWIETTMDYDDDPDGLIKMERVDPLEMYWDPQARKKNLSDAKWIQRIRWMSKEDVEDKWPDKEISVSEPWGDDLVEREETHNASLAFLYRQNNGSDNYDETLNKYRVVQHLYFEKEDVWRVLDPVSGKSVFLDEKKFKIADEQAKAQNYQLKFVKQKKKVYKTAFVCGNTVLEEKDLPCGWNFKCMTGKRDNNSNLWFGLGRGMKDPQLWANKFLSQIMHVVNTNAKGGLLAEENAFVDAKKAEETWSDPSAVVLLKSGGLARVKERDQKSYPQGLDKLLQFAIGSIPDVTGLNLEFLGMADRQQTPTIETERKKAAYVILAGFFDSLRLYRKEQGRLLAHYIKEYLNDGRVIRITTDQGDQPVPLHLTEENIEYDIVVDQAPDSPNLKSEVWAQLGELVPAFAKAGFRIPPSIMKMSPLPVDVVNEFIQANPAGLPPQVQQQMQQMQEEIKKLSEENLQLKTQAQVKTMEAQVETQAIQSRHMLGMQKNQTAELDSQRRFAAEMASIKEEAIKAAREAAVEAITQAHTLHQDNVHLSAELAQDDKHHRDQMMQEDRHHAQEMSVQREAARKQETRTPS